MLIPLQDLQEERAWSRKNDLVCLHLLPILAGQGHVSEVFVFSQFSKGWSCIFFKVIPLKTKLFHDIHSSTNDHLLFDLYLHCQQLIITASKRLWLPAVGRGGQQLLVPCKSCRQGVFQKLHPVSKVSKVLKPEQKSCRSGVPLLCTLRKVDPTVRAIWWPATVWAEVWSFSTSTHGKE